LREDDPFPLPGVPCRTLDACPGRARKRRGPHCEAEDLSGRCLIRPRRFGPGGHEDLGCGFQPKQGFLGARKHRSPQSAAGGESSAFGGGGAQHACAAAAARPAAGVEPLVDSHLR